MDLCAILFTLGQPILEFVALNPKILFWLTVCLIGSIYGFTLAILSMFTGFVAYVSSMPRKEGSLPRYKGPLDILLGRTFRASKSDPKFLANNNVSLVSFANKMVIAYRSAETHFASPSAKITVATSTNLEDWHDAWTYSTGQDDLREVLLWMFEDRLFLYFCSLAPNKRGFAPKGMSWTSTRDLKVWTDPVAMGRKTEITWDIKVHEGTAYKVGYIGNHYSDDCTLSVVFECSGDGENWKSVGKSEVVYVGGISEVSFAFTSKGDLVAIGRNEDGDHTGFGSQLFFAPRQDLGSWTPLKVCLPQRFDSPRMAVLSGEVVVFARYAQDPYTFVPDFMPFLMQKIGNIIAYSSRPKSSAVYKINIPDDGQGTWPKEPIQLIRCFEDSFGDTGFFSVAKMCDESDDWVVANYASPVHSHATWFYGQVYATNIYVCRCVPILR
mmetsp:Transcript_26541/g.48857  ORF Transcript_26541/g.48857 Transcript_26541/m.48857 type:complete len:440 (-) Transcript_26541:106-1425(-)